MLERARAAGSAMSEIASSVAAMRRSRMPVRSRIHSSEVSTSVASSSFVTHALGHVAAEPGDRDRGAVRARRSRRSTAKVSVAAHGELAADRRARLAAADRTAHRLDLAREVEHVARPRRSA